LLLADGLLTVTAGGRLAVASLTGKRSLHWLAVADNQTMLLLILSARSRIGIDWQCGRVLRRSTGANNCWSAEFAWRFHKHMKLKLVST
jgi:hypothetical protein